MKYIIKYHPNGHSYSTACKCIYTDNTSLHNVLELLLKSDMVVTAVGEVWVP